MTVSDYCTATRINGEILRITMICCMNCRNKFAKERVMRDEPKVNRLNMKKGRTGLTPVATGTQSWEKAITSNTLERSIALMRIRKRKKQTQNDIKAANRPDNNNKFGIMHNEET